MKKIVFLLFCLASLMVRSQNAPNIIFADNFETYTLGTIPFDTVMTRWQAVMPNYYAPNQSIISVDGHGQVWRSQYLANDCGAPRGIEIAALLDTVLEEIWVEVDAYHASGWYDDSSDGHYSGKMLAGGAYGGSHWLVVNNPYIVDTTGTVRSNGWSVHSGWGNGNPNRLFMYIYDQLSWNYQINMGYVHPGEWHRYTTRIKMNTPGKKNGIAERYKDGVLVAQDKTMLFRSLAQYNAGICDIEGLVIKYAFGGSNDMCSDRPNIIYFDNVVAYTYPPKSPHYLVGPAPAGHTIPRVSGTVTETIYPDPILYDETFTAPSGTVRSHYTGGSFVPFSITKTYTKTITRQTSPITMSFNRWHNGTNRADGYDCWVKIYSGTGEGKTLVKQYQEPGEYDGVPVIGDDLIINHTSATIEYFTGRDRSMGWALEYSPGSALPAVTVSATDASAAEQGQDPSTFTIARSNTSEDLTVNYAISGTASANDYTPTLTGSITIPSGSSAATVTVTPVNDTAPESSETLILTISSNAAYVVGSPSSATIVIFDDDVLQFPYGGTPRSIPGTIQIEDFDTGGEGVAYHDNDATNNGGGYRTTEGVDIHSAQSEGSHKIGWFKNGEWMEYTVDIEAGTYDISIRAGNPNNNRQLKVYVDNSLLTTIDVTNTGSYGTFQTITVSGIEIPGGNGKILKLENVNDDFDFNWIQFVKISPTAISSFGKSDALPVIYPNPLNNELRISNTENITRAELINISGETLVVKHNPQAPEMNIDTKSLKSGVFILRLFDGTGEVSTHKVVK